MSWSETLQDLVSTAGTAYQSYQSSQAGYTPLAPNTYIGPNGQVVTTNTPLGATTSTTTTLLLLGVLALVFFFAFTALRK